MVSIKQLGYALAAEKTLHFKKAAELSHVSQSTFSTAINELEQNLGIHIFERNNKKVMVTPLGEKVLDQAREIMNGVKQLNDFSKELKSPLSFPLSIGIIPTVAPFFLPKLLPALKQQYPNAQLKIIEEQSHVLVDKLRNGEIDSAVLALPYDINGLTALTFWEEDFYWITPKNSDKSKYKEISSKELTETNLMLLHEGHCLKNHILDVCKLPTETSGHNFGATSLNTLIHMVKGGLGTTLIPEMALEQLVDNKQELSAVPLKENSPHRSIAFVIRPNYTRMSSIEILINLSQEALATDEK